MTTYPLSPAWPASPRWVVIADDVAWCVRYLLSLADEVLATTASTLLTIYRALRRVPGECWPPIACTGFAVFCGYMFVSGMLADSRSWAEVFQPVLTTVALVIGAPLVLSFGAVLGGHTNHAHSVAGCAGKVHYANGSDAGRQAILEHERAHQIACAKAGGGGSTVHIKRTSDGGWAGVTKFHNPGKVAKLAPERQVAIHLAGITRRPDTDSPNDIPNAKAAAGGSRDVMKQGQKLANRWVHGARNV